MKKTPADATIPDDIPGNPGNPSNPPSKEAPRILGGGQSLFANEYYSIKQNLLVEVEEFRKKCVLLIEENQLLHKKIRSLEARLAKIEKNEESYHTDEEEFTFPQKGNPKDTI